MRVTFRESGTLLVVDLKPARMGASLGFGLAFFILGMLVATQLGRRTEFVCEPRGGGSGAWCWAASRGVMVEGPLAALAGARTEVRTSFGFVATRTLVVTLKGQDVALGFVRPGGVEKDEMAAQINRVAVGQVAPPLRYVENMRLVGLLFGLVVAGGGVVILLAIERIRVVVDRGRNLVTIRGSNALHRRYEAFALDQVERIESEAFMVKDATSYSVVFRLKGGAEVPIARTPLFTQSSSVEVLRLLRRAEKPRSEGM